jgi:predicted transcriptional regulator
VGVLLAILTASSGSFSQRESVLSDFYDEGSDLYIMIKSKVPFGFNEGECAMSTKSAKKSAKKSKSGKKLVTKTKVKPTKARSGQSGPKIDVLPWEKMNEKERLVFKTLARSKELTLEALAEKCFTKKGARKANSWARNSLRRLVRAGLVKRVDEGTYRLGSKKLQHVKLDAKKAARKKPVAKAKARTAKVKARPAKAKANAKRPQTKSKPQAKAKDKLKESNSIQAPFTPSHVATPAGSDE